MLGGAHNSHVLCQGKTRGAEKVKGQSYGPWEESKSRLLQQALRRVETKKRLPEIREKCKHNLPHPAFQNRRKHP